MKHMLLFLSFAATIIFSSCKKDKSPDYDGTPNAISGEWKIDASAMQFSSDAILPEWGFGTNYKYERKGGTKSAPLNEKGTYTLGPGPADGLILTLKPGSGNSYTISVSGLTAKSVNFRETPDGPTYTFLRK
ncbi:hypothetical protein ACQKLP_22330 [Chitinophaga sp. NPDC101104]|uniref:hypothetical protein n=1 Tax=Chitinophaga sp. NPDC101104 TaxID=3390561 RepID=UPI003D00BEB0